MEKSYPAPDPITAPFWEACNKGKLLYQRCKKCEAVQPFPRAVCVECSASRYDLAWHESSKHGTLATYSLVHRGPNKAWLEDQPYLLALVDMEEGFRLMVNLLDCEEAELAVGMEIIIDFVERGPEGQLIPQGRIASAG